MTTHVYAATRSERRAILRRDFRRTILWLLNGSVSSHDQAVAATTTPGEVYAVPILVGPRPRSKRENRRRTSGSGVSNFNLRRLQTNGLRLIRTVSPQQR